MNWDWINRIHSYSNSDRKKPSRFRYSEWLTINLSPWISLLSQLILLEYDWKNSRDPSIISHSTLSGKFICAYKCKATGIFLFPGPMASLVVLCLLCTAQKWTDLMVMVRWPGLASPAIRMFSAPPYVRLDTPFEDKWLPPSQTPKPT